MLRSLHIENIAVIRRADLEPENGFSVLTGETGAGKSIIIDSINLLMGNRVPREILRTGESKASVSAVFEEIAPGVCNTLGVSHSFWSKPDLSKLFATSLNGLSLNKLCEGSVVYLLNSRLKVLTAGCKILTVKSSCKHSNLGMRDSCRTS